MAASRYLRGLRDARYLVREAVWSRRKPYASPYPLSFALDPKLLAATRIHWPQTYGGADSADWVDAVVPGFRTHVPVLPAAIPQLDRNAVLFDVEVNGKRHPVTLDFDDLSHVITEELLSRSAVYFKMQHHRDGYADHRIVPGGFVTSTNRTYHYLSPLRSLQEKSQPRNDVYGRFSLRFAGGLRSDVVRLLQQQQRFRYEGGLQMVRYSRYLEEIAGSKVCIDLPGNGAFCYRLVDYFSLGSCVVAYPHENVLHVPLEQGKQIAWCRPDLSDLVELISHYLDREDEAARMREASREHFDRYLHRDQLTAYYLSTVYRLIQ